MKVRDTLEAVLDRILCQQYKIPVAKEIGYSRCIARLESEHLNIVSVKQ